MRSAKAFDKTGQKLLVSATPAARQSNRRPLRASQTLPLRYRLRRGSETWISPFRPEGPPYGQMAEAAGAVCTNKPLPQPFLAFQTSVTSSMMTRILRWRSDRFAWSVSRTESKPPSLVARRCCSQQAIRATAWKTRASKPGSAYAAAAQLLHRQFAVMIFLGRRRALGSGLRPINSDLAPGAGGNHWIRPQRL